MRSQPVENVGRHCCAACEICDKYYDRDWNRVKGDYREAEDGRQPLAAAFLLFFILVCTGLILLQEEANRHRNHREHTGSEQSHKTPCDSFQDEPPYRFSFPGRRGVRIILSDRFRAGVGRKACTGGKSHVNGLVVRRNAVRVVAGLPFNGHRNSHFIALQKLQFLADDHRPLTGSDFNSENVIVSTLHLGRNVRLAQKLDLAAILHLEDGSVRTAGTIVRQVVDVPGADDGAGSANLIDIALDLHSLGLP